MRAHLHLIPLITVFVVLAFVPLAMWVLHGPVNAASLNRSLANEVGGSPQGCRQPRADNPRVWRCEVLPQVSSTPDSFRVIVEPGSSCWEAKRLPAGAGAGIGVAASGSSCVNLIEMRISLAATSP